MPEHDAAELEREFPMNLPLRADEVIARRREIIVGLGVVAWPCVARAQAERGRRVGVLSAPSESDPEMLSWVAEFVQELARLGWVDGRNLQIDER